MNAVLTTAPTTTPTTAPADIERPPIDGAMLLPLGLLRPNPWNRQVDAAGLPGLADTIRTMGVMQPAVVRPIEGATAGQPLYEIVCGERRWRASHLAGQADLPCLVRHLDDHAVRQMMLVENLQRDGLHELDEAAGYDQLLRKDSGPQALRGFTSVDELAKSIGRSPSYVAQRLRLLKLCPEGTKAFREGRLTFSLALRIARLPDPQDQAEATRQILSGWGGDPMTARQADDYIHRQFMLELDSAPFKASDATLLPDAGSCHECPKRTGANADLFPDIKKGDTCTDSACYRRKEDAHHARLKAEAEARGLTVITGAAAKKIKPSPYSDARGYLELDKVHHGIDAKKPLRKLLAKADVKPVLVEDPHSRALVEMVDEKQATAALQAAGVLKQSTARPDSKASEREAAAKAKRETAWRLAVADAIGQAARGDAGSADDFRAWLVQRVAVMLWHELHNDTRQRLLKLLGWPPLKPRWDKGPGVTAQDHISGLAGPELCRYLTLAIVAGDTHVAAGTGPQPATELLAMAERLGVDVQACKDSAREVSRSTPDAAAARRAQAKAAELTPETALAAAVKRAKATPKPAARYRCPLTGSTWSGRGLQPAWLKAALANGQRLQDFDTQALPAATQGAGGTEQAPAKAGADMADESAGSAS